MLDLDVFTFGGSPDYPSANVPSARDPSQISDRYAVKGSGHTPEAVDPAPGSSPAVMDMRHVAEGAKVPTMLFRRMPQLAYLIPRAIADGDFDAVNGFVKEISDFKDSNLDALTAWSGLESKDPRLASAAEFARSIVTDDYKARFAGNIDGQRVDVDTFLSDNSEEAKARRASKIARDLNLSDSSVARGFFDRDSALYPVLGQFRSVTSALPPDADDKKRSARVAARSNAKDVARFAQEFVAGDGDLKFSTAADAGDFVAAYNSRFNADNTVSGLKFMRSAARGFLASGSTDVGRYVSQLKELRDNVEAGLVPQKTEAGKRSMMHEANDLVSALVDETYRLRGGVPLESRYADALVDTVKKASVLSDMYGIDLRLGSAGFASTVARMALKASGVAGVDDQGVTEFLTTVSDALDQYKGSDGQPRVVEGRNGQRYVQPVPGPYGNIESAICSAVGRTLWDMHVQSGGSLRGSGQLLASLAHDPDRRERVRSAVRDVLRSRFTDEAVADAVADRIYMNPLNGSSVTVARALDDVMELRRADGSPKIPENVLIKENASGVGRDVLVALANRPGDVIKADGADPRLRDAAIAYAQTALKDQTPDGHGGSVSTESSRDHRMKALGDLVVASDRTVALGSTAARMTAYALRVAGSGDFDKAIRKSRLAEANLTEIAEGIRKRDPEAIAAGALICSVVPFNYAEDPLRTATISGYAFAPSWLSLSRQSSLKAMDAMQEALRSVTGIDIRSQGTSIMNELKAVLGKAATQTLLVRSGVLNLDTGKIDETGFLARLQRSRYEDPVVMSNRKNDPMASDLAIRARKVATTLMPETTVIGRFVSQYERRLEAEGYKKEDVASRVGRAARIVGAAYRLGGDKGAYHAAVAADKFLSYSVRYKPTVGKDAKGAPVLNTQKPAATQPMTDEEYQDSVKVDTDLLREVFPNMSADDLTAAYMRTDVDGRANDMEQRAFQHAQMLNYYQGLGKAQVKKETEEP